MAVRFLDNGAIAPGPFLKVNLLGRDVLPGCAVGGVVRVGVDVGGGVCELWEVVIGIKINLVLGVGVVMQGLVDSALQCVLLLPLQEIKQSLVLPRTVPVPLAGRCTHLTI
jgi:hypothetical protein